MTETLNDYTLDRFETIRGAEVYSSDDEKIGKVEELFTDIDTGRPEWIGVGTGIFRTKRVLVPIEGATWSGDAVRVPYAKDVVEGAPDIDRDDIGEETESMLASHYGVSYSETASDTGLPDAPATGTSEASVTRSEEELTVGTRRTEAGRVRLHKWVETQPVEASVSLTRDVAEVRREPIDRPADAGDIGEQEIEVTLEKDEAVVDKRTVAKERVTLDTETVSETQTVADEVRKEHVEIDGDDIGDERRAV